MSLGDIHDTIKIVAMLSIVIIFCDVFNVDSGGVHSTRPLLVGVICHNVTYLGHFSLQHLLE